jgi:hypothetical protein
MERENLKELRPLVTTYDSDGTKPAELFQNEVLRPVIKFQHDLILALVKGNDRFSDIIRKKGTRLEYFQTIQLFISKQPKIKYRLIGTVIGLLTLEELDDYKKDQREYDQRIIRMICQRLVDTLY